MRLEELEKGNACDSTSWLQNLFPVDTVLRELKAVKVNTQAQRFLSNGQSVGIGRVGIEAEYLEEFRMYSEEGEFFALARCDLSTNSWKPVKVFQIGHPSPYSPA